MSISLSIRLGLGSNTGVSILGSARVGDTLSLSAVYLEGSGPDLTYRAQWLVVTSGGVQTPIVGAIGATYIVGYSDAGLGIRAMVETPTGGIIYSQIVNIPVTQPAPLDALAVTVAPHPTNPALIRIVYNGPLPPNGGSPITAVRRERFVGGVSQGVYHLRTGGALPVVGGVYDVPGETGVNNTVFIYAENATSGAPNKGTPHIVVPGSATQAPGAVALLTVTPGDGQNAVTFAAPATGGAPVDYLVEATTDGLTYVAVTTILAAGPLSHVHTGLTNGTAYTYRVTARNSGGSGAAATASGTPVAPAVAPTITAEASVTADDLGASIRYTFTNPTATGTDPINISISAATLDGVGVLGSFSGLSVTVVKTSATQALAVTFLASNGAGTASSNLVVTVASASALAVNITEAASDRFVLTPNTAGIVTLPLDGTTTAADDADIEIRLVERFRRDTLTSLFASTRAAVLALKDDLTTNGVGSAVLRPVSALAGTAGLTINTATKTITVAAGTLVMVSYVNFDGWKIIGNAGSHFVPIYCLIGNPGNGAMTGGNFFALDLYPGSVVTGVPGARLDAYFCSFESSGSGSNALQTLIKVRVNNNGVSVAPTTNLHHCRLAGYTSDSFKPVRGRVEFCYIDPAVTGPGAHADLVTVPACDPAIGVQFRACYFNQDSAARGAGYTGFPAVTDGVNNVIRIGPGTGGIAQTAFGQVLVSECIFERDPNTVSKSFQFVEATGVTVTSPIFVNNKWIKDDVSASRWYPNETTAVEWGNNLTPADATTSPPAAGTSVTAPAYTDPADWADIDIRAIIDWTPAGVALSSAWTASLTFPTTPFDVVVSARVAGSAAVDTAINTYRAGTTATSYVTTLDEYPEDGFIIDADLARGNNAASVFLSGGSDAPNGEAVEARLVSIDDGGATSTAWKEIATVSGGAGEWSGSLTGVQWSPSFFRAQTRVKGSSAPAAQMTARIGVGLVGAFWGASNTDKGTDQMGVLTPPLETIGVSASDPQFFRWTKITYGANAPGYNVSRWVNDDEAYTSQVAPIRAMAAAFHKLKPGLKVHAIFESLSGSPEINLLSEDPMRPWAQSQAAWAAIRKDASGNLLTPLGFAYKHGEIATEQAKTGEWFANMMWGKDLAGADVPALQTDDGNGRLTASVQIPISAATGRNTVWHTFAHLLPELRSGRCQTLFHNSTVGSAQNTTEAIDSLVERAEHRYNGYQQILAAMPNLAKILPVHNDGMRGMFVYGAVDNVHTSTIHDAGFPRDYRNRVFGILRGTGLISAPIPAIDIIQWDPNWLRLGSTAGPITTRARKTSGVGATNHRGNAAQVTGFWRPDFSGPTRTEIRTPNPDGSPGALAAAGNIYIYPETGQTYNGSSGMYWHVGDSWPGAGAGFPGALDWEWYREDLLGGGGQDHVPIVDVGLPNMPGLMPAPRYDNHEFINDANGLPSLFGVDDYTSIPATPVNTGYSLTNPTTPTANAITIDAVIQHGGVSAQTRLLSVNNNVSGGYLRVTTAGAVVFSLATSTASQYLFICQTPDGVVPDGTTVRIRVTAKRTSTGPEVGDVHCWVDTGAGFVSQDGGTPAANTAFGSGLTWAFAGNFASGGSRQFHIGQLSQTPEGKVGKIAVFAGVEHADTADHDPLTAGLYVRANAAETGFEKWNGSTWVVL